MGQDHYLIVIGDNGMAHIIEHLMGKNNSFYTDTAEGIAKLLVNIKNGITPDRFYGFQNRHKFEISSWTRKSLSKSSVIDYISA